MLKIEVTHIPNFKSMTLVSPKRYELGTTIPTLKACGWFVRKKTTHFHKNSIFGKVEEFVFIGENSLKNKCSLINSFAQCTLCGK